MSKLNDLAENLNVILNHLDKVGSEVLAKLEQLSEALLNVELPPDAQIALDALVAKARELDDIVPDSVESVDSSDQKNA